MSSPRKEESEQFDTISIDDYRVRARIRPADLGEEPPRTWSEVVHQVNHHLMRLVSGTTRLAVEPVEGLACLLRGVTSIPAAVAGRIEEGHVKADVKEATAQDRLDAGTAEVLTPDRAMAGGGDHGRVRGSGRGVEGPRGARRRVSGFHRGECLHGGLGAPRW